MPPDLRALVLPRHLVLGRGIDPRSLIMSQLTPFHLAFTVDDLQAARRFYGGVLGCPEGRSSETWIDFNLFGHQIVAHLSGGDLSSAQHGGESLVDGHSVPVPHFGVVLPPAEWTALAVRLAEAEVKFVIEPYTRFEGQPGEQSTMFFLDPAGNALEFKSFAQADGLFAH